MQWRNGISVAWLLANIVMMAACNVMWRMLMMYQWRRSNGRSLFY